MTISATILLACIAIAVAAIANVLNTLLQCRDTISGRIRLGWLGVLTVVVSCAGAIFAGLASYLAWDEERQNQVSTSEAYAALSSRIESGQIQIASTIDKQSDALAKRMRAIEDKIGVAPPLVQPAPPVERTDLPIVQSTTWQNGQVTLNLSGPRGTRITDNFSTTPFKSSGAAVKLRVELINVPVAEQPAFRAQIKSDKRLGQDGDRSQEFGAGSVVAVSAAGGADAGFYLVTRGRTSELMRKFPNAAVRLTIVP